jgi:hypothetical protein
MTGVTLISTADAKRMNLQEIEAAEVVRAQQIQAWVDAGWTEQRIANSCHSAWKLGKAEVREILKALRNESKEALEMERAEFMAQQMTRIESLAGRAIEEGNLAVALGAYKELHMLAGLYKK